MKNETVKQRLPYEIPYEKVAVEQELPHDDAAVKNEISRLEEGEASSCDSDTSVSSRSSRRTRMSSRSRRRLKPRRAPVDLPQPRLSRSARSSMWTAPRTVIVSSRARVRLATRSPSRVS
ncbi:hypothetical protein PF003_g26094 [Phytophthora fragariae]|nr:hypothetical protein PF003_g26094 [Phytophthora fragariae]